MAENLATLLALGGFVVYCLAAWCIAQVIQSRRAPQAIVAWGISLLTLPILAVPLYAVFGRNRFHGYVRAHRTAYTQTSAEARALDAVLAARSVEPPEGLAPLYATIRNLTALPFASGNSATLLIDGHETYGAMLEAIGAAQDYVLIQSYIVHDDGIGRRFRDALVSRAAAGVIVYFLYDEIGCVRLPGRYLQSLRDAGVLVAGFKTTRGPGNRWQINFRNHRKILVVDGHCAFLGGLNIGDEYLGRVKRLGPWRDTHLKLTGPSVQMTQMAFLEDWYWAERAVPVLRWQPEADPVEGVPAVVVRTGPADAEAVCELLHVQLFNSARTRLWVAEGYFVPDEPIIRALQLAALRGVDVRLMLPAKADIRTALLASFAYLPPLVDAGVKVFLYQDGVLHQKVVLVDDVLASVSSANLDNRSLHINFEITALIADKGFAATVERMLLADFAHCEAFTKEAFDRKPYWFRLACRAAHLAAPLL
jgi:cardiolipin synthase A/B